MGRAAYQVDRSTHEALGRLSWHHLLLNHEVGGAARQRQFHKHPGLHGTRRTLGLPCLPGPRGGTSAQPPPHYLPGYRLCSRHRGPQGEDDIPHSSHKHKICRRPEQGHLINCLECTPILVETEKIQEVNT